LARNKPTARKRRLARAMKENRAVPAWVVARTSGRVRTNPSRRNWRRGRLKV